MIKKSIRLRDPLPVQEPQSVEIPRYLPLIVQDVAESLLMRDPELAKRYLEAHLNQKSRVRKDDSILDLIGDN